MTGCHGVDAVTLPDSTPMPTLAPVPAAAVIPADCLSPAQAGDGSSETFHYRYYLPPCYDSQAPAAYPVVYLLHGASGYGAIWEQVGVVDQAAELMLQGKVPPFILIMPSYDEFKIGDLSASVMVADLIPAVEARFRILPGREYHAVAGASLGGGVAGCMALRYPQIFGSAGVFGGGIPPGFEPTLTGWIDEAPQADPPRVFIDIGMQDGIINFTQAYRDVLDEKKIDYRLVSEEGGHSFAYWGQHFPLYFEWLAESWQAAPVNP